MVVVLTTASKRSKRGSEMGWGGGGGEMYEKVVGLKDEVLIRLENCLKENTRVNE